LKSLNLKKITKEDKDLIYKWRKKKFVKKYLLNQNITKLSHSYWLQRKINSKIFSAWLIKFNKKKIGLVQVDSIKKKNICNAGYYIANLEYSFLTFEVMNILHNLVFEKLKFKKIESYISNKNLNIRKLNKFNGYKESNKKHIYKNFIITYLTLQNWKKSKGYIYFKKKYGKL
jgi:uncharacterized membrane-anchored protein YitT (DUF2179 family)